MGAPDFPFDNPNRERAGDPVSGSVGYGGGSSVIRRWKPAIRDAAGDTLRALPTQRAQIRELARTNGIAAGALETNVGRVIGTGLALVARPNAAVLGMTAEQVTNWKTQAQIEFSLWADSKSCDIDGEQTFYEKQGLTLRSALESGDCFTLLPDGAATATQPYKLRLQTIEADRVGNPAGQSDNATIAGGIERTAAGKQCFLYDTHPGAQYASPSTTGSTRYAGKWIQTIGASGRRRLLHHYRQLRPEQPRGVPYLAPVIDLLKQLSRYSEAEIQNAVMSAMFTVFIEHAAPAGSAPIHGMLNGMPTGPDGEMGLGYGAAVDLAPGETVKFADPSRPNPNFDFFVKSVVMQIGVGLGLPYELLIKQFNSSYSASKAALLDAWIWFRSMRAWMAGSFCQPIYETWLAEAVATGRIIAPGFFTDPRVRWAYCQAEWHGDSMGTINPKDDVAAYVQAINARLMTAERAEWELGGSDFWQTLAEKKAEQEALAAANLLPIAPPGSPGAGDTPSSPNQPPDS